MVGDPNKPGFYMYYNKWTKGNHFSRPHFHPNDRYIVVLQGTWWVGTGPHFDPAQTKAIPAGSFVTHFGKEVHWDGAKDEDAVPPDHGRRSGNLDAGERRVARTCCGAIHARALAHRRAIAAIARAN